MNIARAAVLVFAAVTCGSACATRRSAVVVLLPDQGGKTVGRAVVENKSGAVNLAADRDTVRVRTDERPARVTPLSEADVQKLFGEALAALPPPPRRFTLNFRFESDELTDEARALVPDVLNVMRDRQGADILVTGHTDTLGTRPANFQLGLKRATMVRDLLIAAGVDASRIEVSSLGETDLLVSSADDAPEPRNRRVDITIR
jgi:OmpA-OmpF porin, OOP family